jgi:hypothetical protein
MVWYHWIFGIWVLKFTPKSAGCRAPSPIDGCNNYKLKWGKRQGFAKLALDAGVPIIPGFTENVEGLYHAPLASHPILQNLYEKTRLPLVPIVGIGPLPFPVRLTTWLGAPLVPKPNESAAELALRTRQAIETLIEEHQIS